MDPEHVPGSSHNFGLVLRNVSFLGRSPGCRRNDNLSAFARVLIIARRCYRFARLMELWVCYTRAAVILSVMSNVSGTCDCTQV